MVVIRSCNTKRRRKVSWKCKLIDRFEGVFYFVFLRGMGRI